MRLPDKDIKARICLQRKGKDRDMGTQRGDGDIIEKWETALEKIDERIKLQTALENNLSERVDATLRELRRVREYKEYLEESRADFQQMVIDMQDLAIMAEEAHRRMEGE